MKRLLLIALLLLVFSSVASAAYYEGGWIVPAANLDGGWTVTSPFGYRGDIGVDGASEYHGGIDIAAQGNGNGGNAVATADGICTGVEWLSGYGLSVWIYHQHPAFPEGVYTLYAHGYAALVSEGDTVTKGQPVTIMESEFGEWTGIGSGPHLHFEVRQTYDPSTRMDPALFVADLANYTSGESMQVGVPYRIPSTDGSLEEFKTILFEFKYEMVKGFREIFEAIANAIIDGFKHIHTIIRSLFIVLIMIDLALATMNVVLTEKNVNLTGFFVSKFMFYGVMLMMITKFPDLCNHLVKDFFLAATGRTMSLTEAEVARVISDPMLILEKGLHIIQPLLNNAMSFQFPSSLTDWVIFAIPGSMIVQFILTLLGIIVFLVLLLFITIQIALAYLEFYISFLFAFTTLIFAGTHVTRQTRLANRGLTAVFGCTLNLMFYAMLTVLLTQSLVAIANQAEYAQVSVQKPSQGIEIKSAEDLRQRIRMQETGNPPNYQSMGGGGVGEVDGTNADYYGAFHISVSDWESWTEEAWNDGAPLIPSVDGGSYPTPGCRFKWTPENQEALVLWKLQKEYERSGSWEQAAREFYNHSGPHNKSWNEYWGAVAKKTNDGQPQKVKSGVNNFIIVLELNICLLIFVAMAIRMSNSIRALFKGQGFELLTSQDH